MLDLTIPTVELPRTGRLTVRTPEIPEMRRWFLDHLGWRVDLRVDPDGLGGVSLPRTKLDQVVDLLLVRWPAVELFRQYVPELRCTHRCRFATKLLCTCPCSGEQHGSQAAELPLSMGEFDMIGTGFDDWSAVVITRVAEAAARMAENPDKMVSFGEETRIAQDVQELVIRATRLSALKEAAELSAADREG